MSDEQVYIDDARRILRTGPNAEVAQKALAAAQISIAISLQRIADVLEREPRFFAGIWDNKPPENPDFEYSADKWRDGLPTRPGYYWHRDIDPGCGEAYEWVVLLVQYHPETHERLVVVPGPAPISGEWGPRIPDPEEVREMAEESASPVGDASIWGKGLENLLDLQVSGVFQNLANLCDRHKRAALPSPTSSTCARCAEERKPGPRGCYACGQPPHDETSGHKYAPAFVTPEDQTSAVSQPATFESLAPTPLTEPPNECWCGIPAADPVHDPKYGSHVFGTPAADKSYGGTE